MSAMQGEWGNAVGRKSGKRDEGRYREHSNERKGRKRGSEGRKTRKKGRDGINKAALIQKKNRAKLYKVLVERNKGMRTCAHLMIKK